MKIKYVHTNIVSSDWKSLADFYINVFGCQPILPERNLSGSWLEKGLLTFAYLADPEGNIIEIQNWIIKK